MKGNGSIPGSGTVPPLDGRRPIGSESVHLNVPGCASRAALRRGYMLVEVQAAFVLLGIGLAGLCPLVVMQLRQVRQLEMRLRGQVIWTSTITGVSQTMVIMSNGEISPTPTYYIVPWQNPWAQKLTGSAQIVEQASIPCDPGPLANPSNVQPSATVTVLPDGLDIAPYSQSPSVYVDVTPL